MSAENFDQSAKGCFLRKRENISKCCLLKILQRVLRVRNTVFVLVGGYKTFFMLNSAEHEIFSANKYENANNSWHFHIY